MACHPWIFVKIVAALFRPNKSDFGQSSFLQIASFRTVPDFRFLCADLSSINTCQPVSSRHRCFSPIRVSQSLTPQSAYPPSFVRSLSPPAIPFSFYTFRTHFIRLVVFTSASEPSKIKYRFDQTEGLILSTLLASLSTI